ncbi:Translin-associated protein X, partial [Stegodyphus mimosarum]
MNNRGRRGQGQRKRKNYNKDDEASNTVPEDASHIVKLFHSYQTELDAKYDKYERLIKKSRDLTIESKRIIFLLHRVSSDENKDEILREAEKLLKYLVIDVINGIALELTKREVFQYLRAFSPGLQEYVEAVSFYQYLRSGCLIHINEVHNPTFSASSSKIDEDADEKEKYMKAELPLSVILTPTDFILGIADLTGELMRKCINSVASGNIQEPFELCLVLQNIYEAFLVNSNYSKDLKRKLYTLKCSLQKVENACYAIKIRGSEIPKHMLADFFSNEEFKEPVDPD